VIDNRLEGLAASQFTVFATWQLGGIDVDRRAVIARARDGRLRRLFRGVYSTSPYLPVRGRLMAAVLAYGPNAVLSHRPAGLVLDITKWKGGPIDVTVPHGTRSRSGIRAHQAQLLPQDHTTVDNIPVTSVARTLLDLAATITPTHLQRAYENAEARGILDTTAISELLARSNGHRGAGALTALLTYDPTAAAGAISELDRLFLDLLRAHGIPAPQTNVLVDGFLVDAYWPDANLVIELDGYEFHNDRDTFESDRRKWTSLRRAGHELLVFTYRHVVDDPEWVAATVTDPLAPSRLPVRCRRRT
jgi:very-short-patch-repair endonuclease